MLEQRTAHYERILSIIEDELDVDRLQSMLSSKQTKKRKKHVEDSEEDE